MPTLERLTLADVEFEFEKRELDTVLVCFPDSHGRLVGVRVPVDLFLREVASAGLRVPANLLCTDATGALATGYALSHPAGGLPDLIARVDPAGLFRVPWQRGTAGAIADVEFADGTAVTMSPRTVLRRQVQRLDGGSMTLQVGTEVQFTVLADGAEPVPARGFGHLVARSATVEPVVGAARRMLGEVPILVGATSGLVSPGGFEVSLRAVDPLRAADEVAIARDCIRSAGDAVGRVVTFMPALDTGLGTGLHVNVSARGSRGSSPLADRYGEGGLSEVGKSFVAGILAHAAELSLLYAPTVNAYRRYGADAVTPRRLDWGPDNRTCAIRVVERGGSLQVENRLASSDANPYLALAAMIASGIDGYTRQLRLAPLSAGVSQQPGDIPRTLAHAVDLWADSTWVRDAFGREVQEHYTVLGRLEAMAAPAAADVSWERQRYLDAM